MPIEFFEWCETTALGQIIRDSLWLFPVIEATHLLLLCLLFGSILIVDIRMLGFGVRGQSIAELARAARPWQLAAIAGMVLTGALLFVSEAVKCYHNPSFWVKMTALPIALLFTVLVRQPIAGKAVDASGLTRVVAIVSIGLWLTVAAAGRWIGLSS